eukprot:119638-Chlamydomonas_euryale.AAC.1
MMARVQGVSNLHASSSRIRPTLGPAHTWACPHLDAHTGRQRSAEDCDQLLGCRSVACMNLHGSNAATTAPDPAKAARSWLLRQHNSRSRLAMQGSVGRL